jgi:hypothetical protein
MSKTPGENPYEMYRRIDAARNQHLLSVGSVASGIRQWCGFDGTPCWAAGSRYLWWRREYARDDWKVSIHAHANMSVSKQHYHIQARLEALEIDEKLFSNQWDCDIPRDHN